MREVHEGESPSVQQIACHTETLHKERVNLRATNTTIEIFHKNHVRMASHKRRHSLSAGRYITDEAHMPPNHRAMHRARQFEITGGVAEERGYLPVHAWLVRREYTSRAAKDAKKASRAKTSPARTWLAEIQQMLDEKKLKWPYSCSIEKLQLSPSL